MTIDEELTDILLESKLDRIESQLNYFDKKELILLESKLDRIESNNMNKLFVHLLS